MVDCRGRCWYTGALSPKACELLVVQRGLYAADRLLVKAARVLWPWSLLILGSLFAVVTILDQHSTYLALNMKPWAQEATLLPRWIISRFGFAGLAVWGVLKIVVYGGVYGGLAAWAARTGLPGIGRMGFVGITYVYLGVSIPVVLNNYRIALA